MGNMIAAADFTTATRWSNKGGAGGAPPLDFAPLLHLLHPLIGEREVERWSKAHPLARAYCPLPAASRPAGAYGLPTMTLAHIGASHDR
jgi:hypothetical protein